MTAAHSNGDLPPRRVTRPGPGTANRRADPAAQLVDAARGDREAFACVYDATVARAFGVALRVLRDPAQAEEVVQDAYLHAWRHSGRFDPSRSSASAWLLTIVHHRAVTRGRSAGAD